jgi:ComF family protein
MSIAELLPTRCACCHQSGPSLCRACRFALAASHAVDAEGVAAALTYDGAVRTTLVALKYRNRRAVARHLAMLMVRRLHLADPALRPDVVTWAPTSPRRVRERGFDQAELLAREVARQLRVPCRRLLYRAHGPAQTGRSREERLSQVGPGFRARPARSGLSVLVVDDVVTTGATLRSAEHALLASGIGAVRLVAAAATPNRRSARPTVPPAASGIAVLAGTAGLQRAG